MIDQQRIDELIRFYTRFSDEERRHKATTIGCYRPTRIDLLKEIFERLYDDGFFQPHDIFVDAGGGDGRVAALGALYYMKTYSIEGDFRIHTLAEKRVQKLQRDGILTNNLPHPILHHGNFLERETYVRLHLYPKSIDIFFNAGDNEAALARFSRQETKNDAYVLLMQSDGTVIERELLLSAVYNDPNNRLLGKIFSCH